jgi:hypothetical protein
MVRGTPQAAAQNSGAIPATIANAAGTVGTGSVGSLLHQLMVGVLLKHDVELSKVRFVNIGASVDVFRAIVVGTVDAGAGENCNY